MPISFPKKNLYISSIYIETPGAVGSNLHDRPDRIGLFARSDDWLGNFQQIGVYATHATDVARYLYRKGLLLRAGNVTLEADHAGTGLDIDAQAIQIAVEQQACLDLAGHPRITERLLGFLRLGFRTGGRSIGGPQADQVVDLIHTIGIGRQRTRELFGVGRLRLALEGYDRRW
jgi:hypothetical protein